MKVLVVNAGSSSLKFQLIDMENENVLAKGNCEKIGIEGSFITYSANGKKEEIPQVMPNHDVAISLVLKLLTSQDRGAIKSLDEIGAIGHRVLHGGEIYTDSVLVNDEVIKNLNSLKPLGPLHMPANIAGILACQNAMPGVPNVAVFDTAFHAIMPKEAFLYAIPYEAYTDWKVRRYGFHGTSHKYVSTEVAKILNKDVKDLKIITVHLGNGSSVAAVKNGRSIDTSMGFTPLEGLIMGTRSGDIDASVVGFIQEKLGLSAEEMVKYLNKNCGALGISGVSSDMRDINKAASEGNERAKLVVTMMAHRIKKYIGGYAAILGGVDAIVFTGGIGENQEDLRELVLDNMEFLGIEIDKEKNNNLPRGTNEEISVPNSKVKVFRIPTNEELVIARDTVELTK
ncbi:MAG: acetate kinase [Clostridia bacterium]|nr:acetate kinase [Clostridia bacterium]